MEKSCCPGPHLTHVTFGLNLPDECDASSLRVISGVFFLFFFFCGLFEDFEVVIIDNGPSILLTFPRNFPGDYNKNQTDNLYSV